MHSGFFIDGLVPCGLIRRRGISVTQQETPELRPARKVLVIDDEESYCLLLARMISALGYKVMTSNQAKSVHLEEMNEQDVIFIDIMMPEMDGLQVLEVITSRKIKSAIVLMSGADNNALANAEALAKKSNLRLIGVLHKPFRLDHVSGVMGMD